MTALKSLSKLSIPCFVLVCKHAHNSPRLKPEKACPIGMFTSSQTNSIIHGFKMLLDRRRALGWEQFSTLRQNQVNMLCVLNFNGPNLKSENDTTLKNSQLNVPQILHHAWQLINSISLLDNCFARTGRLSHPHKRRSMDLTSFAETTFEPSMDDANSMIWRYIG